MEKRSPAKKKMKLAQILGFTVFFVGGVLAGMLLAMLALSDETVPLGQLLFRLGGLLVWLYVAEILQIIIHEGGHLVCGLMSGYTFVSFRVFSWMWVKRDGKLRFKRFSLAGTGGQCLMAPPKLVDGKMPVALYNFGGAIANAVVGLIALGAYFLWPHVPVLSNGLLIFALLGLMQAVFNGVPMRLGMVDNDGYNALSMGKDPAGMRGIWIQLTVNAETAKGVRLREMPAEWFEVPSNQAMKNSMVAPVGVLACNRLMDERRFEEANRLMARLMELDSGMAGLHRSMLICDRIYVEIIGENRRDVLEKMLTKEQKTFMKQMKTNPSVIRTEYLLALAYDRDQAKAEKVLASFEKCAKSYPNAIEIQQERELLALAQERLATREAS